MSMQQKLPAWWTCHIPCADIRTAEVHPALIIKAERAYVAIAIQHVLILLLTTLKPAMHSHINACNSHAQTVCNSCQASTSIRQ